MSPIRGTRLRVSSRGVLNVPRATDTLLQTYKLTLGESMLEYQTFRPDLHFAQTHNDYLQLAAEGGLLVGIPILAALFLFIREVRSRFREGVDDVTTYWIRVGATTGLVAIAFQEFVEFSLQMPGNAVLFAVLAAIAIHPRFIGATGRELGRRIPGGKAVGE